MRYDDALREWGARKAEQATGLVPGLITIDRSTVVVDMDFDEGYACCGGSDPSCYCSQAESPSARVTIRGTDQDGYPHMVTISAVDFDFATVLGEIVEAGDGTLSGSSPEES